MPSNRIEPATILPGGSGTSRAIDRAVTLLPQPGFADEAERLAVADVEADVVDRLDDAVGREEVGRQAADLEQVVGLAADARLGDGLGPRPEDVVRGQFDDGRCVGGGHVLLGAHHLLLSLELRIERVAQTVTEEGEADEREGDADRREDDEVRLGADELLALGDEAAPRRARRLDADADVGERRLGQDRRPGCRA